MRFTFTIDVEAERSEGKFASHDEVAEQIMGAIDDANPGSLEGDSGGMYDVTSWEVTDIPQDTDKKIRQLARERAELEKLRDQALSSVWIVTDREEAKRSEKAGEIPQNVCGIYLTEAAAKRDALFDSDVVVKVELLS